MVPIYSLCTALRSKCRFKLPLKCEMAASVAVGLQQKKIVNHFSPFLNISETVEKVMAHISTDGNGSFPSSGSWVTLLLQAIILSQRVLVQNTSPSQH